MNRKKSDGRKNQLKVSRQLSFILRHGAKQKNIPISFDGFCLLSDLQKFPPLQTLTLEILQKIVKDDEKNRFYLDLQPEPRVRANQGHSLDVEVEMKKISDYNLLPVCIHGTSFKNFKLIQKSRCLKTMGRKHIHFSVGMPGDDEVISGMRKSSDVFIYINVKKALLDGIEFFLSKNNVILSAGIEDCLDAKYFEKVLDRNGNSVS